MAGTIQKKKTAKVAVFVREILILISVASPQLGKQQQIINRICCPLMVLFARIAFHIHNMMYLLFMHQHRYNDNNCTMQYNAHTHTNSPD